MIAALIGIVGILSFGSWGERPGANPEINLSAMRAITCDEGTGSGFMIDDNTLVTAKHVSDMTNCFDELTRENLRESYEDPHRDFAMMTGNLPDIPVIKIDCAGYKKGHTYYAYGYSNYGQWYRIFRQNTMKAVGTYTDKTFMVSIDDDPAHDIAMPGMAELRGNTVPGMSGGYIGSDNGYGVGMVNVGHHNGKGDITGNAFSYEFKNTILCKKV